jgi:hypothetical protein
VSDAADALARLNGLRRRWESERSARAFVQLAEELRRRGELAEAIAVLEEGLNLHTGYLSGQLALARCRLESGEHAAAEPLLLRVLGQDPTQLVAMKLLIQSLAAQDRAEDAEEWMDRYFLLAGRDEDLDALRASLASRAGTASESGPVAAGVAAPPLEPDLPAETAAEVEVGPLMEVETDPGDGRLFDLSWPPLPVPALGHLERPWRAGVRRPGGVVGAPALRDPFPVLVGPRRLAGEMFWAPAPSPVPAAVLAGELGAREVAVAPIPVAPAMPPAASSAALTDVGAVPEVVAVEAAPLAFETAAESRTEADSAVAEVAMAEAAVAAPAVTAELPAAELADDALAPLGEAVIAPVEEVPIEELPIEVPPIEETPIEEAPIEVPPSVPAVEVAAPSEEPAPSVEAPEVPALPLEAAEAQTAAEAFEQAEQLTGAATPWEAAPRWEEPVGGEVPFEPPPAGEPMLVEPSFEAPATAAGSESVAAWSAAPAVEAEPVSEPAWTWASPAPEAPAAGELVEEAEEELEREAPAAPSTEATVTLGQLYLQQGHFADAAATFASVLAAQPWNQDARKGWRQARLRQPWPIDAIMLLRGFRVADGGLTAKKTHVLRNYLRRLRQG